MEIPELYELFKESKGICTDSRKIVPGALFFALKGANFNGNEHALAALIGGCSYAIVDETLDTQDNRVIHVGNVLVALQGLGHHHRNVVDPVVIGITGSNGKTTTKELMTDVVAKSFRTHATKGNFNNHIGVPLTLLSMPADTEVAVIEMGANHIGEIRDLCKICDPNLSIITNIGKAHLEGFGSLEGVKKAKGELYDHIRSKANGELCVSEDNEILMELSSGITRMTYSEKHDSDVSGKLLQEIPFLKLLWGTINNPMDHAIETKLSGRHNLENILCAICVGVKMKVPSEMINEAISAFVPSNNRSEWISSGKNEILLDAYNANPSSMSSAIASFIKLKETDQLLILGDMQELGGSSMEEHRLIVDQVSASGREAFYVGEEFGKMNDRAIHQFNDVNDLIDLLKKDPIKGKQILIKGSRSIALEKVVEFL